MTSSINAYRSCFIVDVQIAKDKIQLLDSSRNKYYIDNHNKEALSSFSSWFKNFFVKAMSQKATVFQYEVRPEEPGSEIEEIYVLKFLTIS